MIRCNNMYVIEYNTIIVTDKTERGNKYTKKKSWATNFKQMDSYSFKAEARLNNI
jgi:hypothetical protein